MADSFLGLKYSLAGLDEELVDLEEEYDALNDETFGSDAILTEDDWENTHTLLAAASESNRGREDDFHDEEGLDVEKSLNQLVLDDDGPPLPSRLNHLSDFRAAWPPPPIFEAPPKMPSLPLGRIPTVEELERQLMEGKGNTSQGNPMGASIAVRNNNHAFLPPPGLNEQFALAGSMGAEPPASTIAGLGFHKPPLFPGPPFPPPGLDPNLSKNVKSPGKDSFMPLHNQQRRPNAPPPMFPGQVHGPFPQELFMRNNQDKLRHALRTMMPMPPVRFPPFMGPHMAPPPFSIMRLVPPGRNMGHPGGILELDRDNFGGGNNFLPPHPLLQQHYGHQNNGVWPPKQQQFRNRRNSDHDEYANLMNNRERTWLLNLQVMQLVTDKPHVDDYYYTMWKKKHGDKQRHRNHHNSDRKRPEPYFGNNRINESQGRERKDSEGTAASSPRVYVPLQFENSLGKLQVRSTDKKDSKPRSSFSED